MCLAIPARIVELLDGDQCRVELGGVRKEISLALVDGAAVGDYVIVHVGYADPARPERRRRPWRCSPTPASTPRRAWRRPPAGRVRR